MANNRGNSEGSFGHRAALLPLLRGLQALKANTKYADFTIKRGARSWKVHKAIVCPQSEFFAKACDGDFKEAEKNSVTLEDDEDAISAMIHYFYHFDYVNDRFSTDEQAPVILDIRVFVIADKYFVPPLRKIALDNIRTRLSTEWNSEAFPTAIREIYGLDPVYEDILKPEVMSTITNNRELLTRRQEYKTFHELMRELNDFAADAAIAVAAASANAGVGKAYKCPKCKGVFSIHRKNSSTNCPHPICYTLHSTEWWSRYEVKD